MTSFSDLFANVEYSRPLRETPQKPHSIQSTLTHTHKPGGKIVIAIITSNVRVRTCGRGRRTASIPPLLKSGRRATELTRRALLKVYSRTGTNRAIRSSSFRNATSTHAHTGRTIIPLAERVYYLLLQLQVFV